MAYKRQKKSLEDCYKFYMSEHKDSKLTLALYREIFAEFIACVVSQIIFYGFKFYIPNDLGSVSLIRYYRRQGTKEIDWAKTTEHKRTGGKNVVYNEKSYRVAYSWANHFGISGRYYFIATRGKIGIRTRAQQWLAKHPEIENIIEKVYSRSYKKAIVKVSV